MTKIRVLLEHLAEIIFTSWESTLRITMLINDGVVAENVSFLYQLSTCWNRTGGHVKRRRGSILPGLLVRPGIHE